MDAGILSAKTEEHVLSRRKDITATVCLDFRVYIGILKVHHSAQIEARISLKSELCVLFPGEKCEEFVEHCRSAPCVQGNCINSHTGFSCHCPFGKNNARKELCILVK